MPDPFDDPAGTEPPTAADTLAPAFAACFRGAEGQLVLAHLRGLTRDRVLGPQASEAELRHLEGQRVLVRHIETLVARGRAPR